MKSSYINKLYTFLQKYSTSYKVEIIKVNISSSFMTRCRCKNCGKGPSYYFYGRNPYLIKDVSKKVAATIIRQKWIKRMAGNWYLKETPSAFIDLKDHKFAPKYYYVPTLHNKTRPPSLERDNILEMLSCECAASVWVFADKAIRNRPEITNRKGRYNYPQKFEY